MAALIFQVADKSADPGEERMDEKKLSTLNDGTRYKTLLCISRSLAR